MLGELNLELSSLETFVGVHSLLLHSELPGLFDLRDALHGLNGLDHQVTVVAHRCVPSLLELKHRIIDELLVVGSSPGFGPAKLSGVLLGLE